MMTKIRGILLFLLVWPMAAFGAVSVPRDLIGIWAAKDAFFKGEILFKGEAIYVDSDGAGEVIVGDDSRIMGQLFEVTFWDRATQTLTLNLIEAGKTVDTASLIYDSKQKTLTFSKEPGFPCRRRFGAISTSARASLGLEPKKK